MTLLQTTGCGGELFVLSTIAMVGPIGPARYGDGAPLPRARTTPPPQPVLKPTVRPYREPPSTWRERASCRGDLAGWYPVGEYENEYRRPRLIEAAEVCWDWCPVRALCLSAALRMEAGVSPRGRHGIWGGLNPTERTQLDPARRRSWRGRSECHWGGEARGLARHAQLNEAPCASCRKHANEEGK